VRALVSLEEYSKEDKFDVIMFPEMAFTNYYYENRKSIESVLEKAGDGPIY
jgi:predicted amidohydrolase